MATGIIYLAIIGMWVAYFLPRWIHNKNEFSGKSVERYKSALKVVAGSNSTTNPESIFTDVNRAGRVAQQLLRRRIIFSLIAITFILTTVGALMKTLTYIAIAIPATALLLDRKSTRLNSSHRT